MSLRDIELLKIGRHFRWGENKLIVGRNKKENEMLLRLKKKTDYLFEVPGWGSPLTLLQGKKTRKAIEFAAQLTATYSDARGGKVLVKYGKTKPIRKIVVTPLSKAKIEEFRVGK